MGSSPPLQPGPTDCVVRMRCNGICGSDVHFWHTGRIGPLIVESDHCLGHEGAGEVVWSGEKVKHLKPGDRVAVEPGVPCGECYQCSSGNYNLCADVAFSGVPPYSGSIRRWHVHPAAYLHKIPDSLSYSDGALLEPLSVVFHGFERSPVRIGEGTVICGAGPIGMCALAVAKASGACPIVVTDLDAGRLKIAQSFAPGCVTFQIDPSKPAEETAKAVIKALEDAGGEQPRVVYECTGVQGSVVTACYMPRAAGEVMVIGVGKPIMNDLPFMHMSLAEVRNARYVGPCLLLTSFLGRSQIHQSIPSLVAVCNQAAATQSDRSSAFGDTQIQTRGSRQGIGSFSRSQLRLCQDSH